MISVQIHAEGGQVLPEASLRKGVREAFRATGEAEGEVSLTFVEDKTIQALNQEYLGKSAPTDVIAFSLHDEGEAPLGDVYVGFDAASRQAEALGIPLDEELLRLAIHGTLHVLGYSHPEEDDREGSPMFLLQEEILNRILSSP